VPTPQVLISVVVPVFQGEKFLEELVAQLEALRATLRESDLPVALAETILVDDGAVDDSGPLMEALAKEHPWVRPLRLSRNFGQHPATIAGILHSSGDWVATLDEDLQHPPEALLPMLGRAVSSSSDLVYAKPRRPVHGVAFRDLSSRWFKRLMTRLTGNPTIRQFNSFRMIRGDIARAAAAVSSHDTYFDIALGWFTDRITSLELSLYDRRQEGGGGSGYGLRSLLRHGRRLLLSSELPMLRLGVVVGGGSVLLSFAAAILVAGLKLFAPEAIVLPGWTSLVLLILFFGGVLSLLVGLTLDYVASLVLRAHGRPTYFAIDRSGDAILHPYLPRLDGSDAPR